jgi:hypothetical protein
MFSRTRTSPLTFNKPFRLPDDEILQPAGRYELTIEEEPIHGLSFEAWRRTNTWLTLHGTGHLAGRVELRPLTTQDLARMVEDDIGEPAPSAGGDAAPVPPEEMR